MTLVSLLLERIAALRQRVHDCGLQRLAPGLFVARQSITLDSYHAELQCLRERFKDGFFLAEMAGETAFDAVDATYGELVDELDTLLLDIEHHYDAQSDDVGF